ncbi:MAG: Polyketide cyclase / dehydrase and lipid transport [Aeromicrobium sp.]|nr:Polyketide cyclase / dehydrase and lipid transport [Aeromicrobium sp.]
MSVVAVDSCRRLVCAAMYASVVVGEDGTKGGLWCSPVAKTSSPTSSAFLAIAIVALMRSCSVGVVPFVGSGVTSPTVYSPNCMLVIWVSFAQLHVLARMGLLKLQLY